MKTACIVASRFTEIQESPTPRPQTEEVLAKVQGCGLCSSSIPVWEGRPWFCFPLSPGAPGHEGWGGIVESRISDMDLQVSMHVALLTHNCFSEYLVTQTSGVLSHISFNVQKLNSITWLGSKK